MAASLSAVIALGLASRRWPLPGLLAEHAGDALYTCAVFCSLALLLPRSGAVALGVAAFALSAAVEFSQLLSWQWLVDLRANRLAALVLGQGFQWADLVAYAAGAAAAAATDHWLHRARSAVRS
ncbi:MAG: DUF2809 domain-containing protein [Planctomycetes bacterium]|nr:DUF2809 domain-containing protein [Planctomycetota bacterium]